MRLRLNRTVSSANVHVGETVDFEVTEPVINQNYVIIPIRHPGAYDCISHSRL